MVSTKKELQERLYNLTCIGGRVRYVISYRNSIYRCESTDVVSYNRVQEHGQVGDGVRAAGGYTYRDALLSLYRQGLRYNNLSIYRRV